MRILFSTLFVVFLLCLTSCSSDALEDITDNNGTKTCRMYFNGDLGSYDEGTATRAALTIPDNAKMYVYFKNGSTTIAGTAVYHKSQGEWSITFDGSLSSSSTCTLYYLVNPGTTSGKEVAFASSTEVYSTTAGSYTYSSTNGITITAKLTPTYSRVRFKGTANTAITVSGMKTPKSFDTSKGTISETSESSTLSVASTGYTPYMYHNGASTSNISITHSGKIFTIKNPLAAGGKTGYIILPTEASHSGWKMAEKIDYNGHDYVDLGLSVKWATMNVGATEVAGSKINSHTGQLDCYGEYYAWGETSPKDSYNWASYKWMASGQSSWDYCTKYTTADSQTSASWYYNNTYVGTSVDGVIYKEKTVLDPEDDAARVNWGGSWRMPTYAEQTELRNNCYWEWTTSYNNSGVKGYIVYKVKNDSDKGKKNNTSSSSQSPTASYSLSDTHIFLPASGCHDDSSFEYVGSNGLYWSSSLSTSDSRSAFDLYFDSDGVYLYTHYRCFGFVVRPICP